MSDDTTLPAERGPSLTRTRLHRWAGIDVWLLSKADWLVAASLATGLALRFRAAEGTYLNPDEALHHLLVNQHDLAAAYRASLTNAHPPLFFVLLYFWRLLGNSEIMLRLPSILLSTAAAWMAFRWIDLVLGKVAGVAALLLLALSPVLTALGAEVRNYALLLFCMASALYFLERALRDQRVASMVKYALFLYLAILSHYSALWFVMAAGVYVLCRFFSLDVRARLAWAVSQLGAGAIYVWLYFVHLSKLRGSPMEAEAMRGWLHALYFHPGEGSLGYAKRTTVDAFQYIFGSQGGGVLALVLFCAGVLGLFALAAIRKKLDQAAFGLLLVMPFLLGMAAGRLDFYPYGGTRHCMYLLPFATAGVSFTAAAIVRQRLLPVLAIAALAPFWFHYRLKDVQQMDRETQDRNLMLRAMEDLRKSVPPGEPIFSDYQSSLLLAYYLDRGHVPPPARECGGRTQENYGGYRVVIVEGWSATPEQLFAGVDGWEKACETPPKDAAWVFDGGWGENILYELMGPGPPRFSDSQMFGTNISVFKLRRD